MHSWHLKVMWNTSVVQTFLYYEVCYRLLMLTYIVYVFVVCYINWTHTDVVCFVYQKFTACLDKNTWIIVWYFCNQNDAKIWLWSKMLYSSLAFLTLPNKENIIPYSKENKWHLYLWITKHLSIKKQAMQPASEQVAVFSW